MTDFHQFGKLHLFMVLYFQPLNRQPDKTSTVHLAKASKLVSLAKLAAVAWPSGLRGSAKAGDHQ